jgi:IS30 family transposase
VSKSSVYRYLYKGYLSAGKMNFSRVVKLKLRKPRSLEYIPKSAKVGRTHDDFLAHVVENGLDSWVETDTMIGRVGGKVIPTPDFTFCNFQAGLLPDNKTSLEAALKIRQLKASLANAGLRFGDLFPVILTDNGGEFANVDAFERDADRQKETLLFFCDPYQSGKKLHCEKNHTLFPILTSPPMELTLRSPAYRRASRIDFHAFPGLKSSVFLWWNLRWEFTDFIRHLPAIPV